MGFIGTFPYVIEYKQGKENIVAAALSRKLVYDDRIKLKKKKKNVRMGRVKIHARTTVRENHQIRLNQNH